MDYGWIILDKKNKDKLQNQFQSSWSDRNVKKIKSEINLVSFRIILNNLFFSVYGITRHAMHVMISCIRDLSDHWLLFLEQKETSLLLTDVIKVFQCQKKKSFHESNYTLVVVFRLNFLKNSQKVNKNTEKANSSIMVDELLLVINPEYSNLDSNSKLDQIWHFLQQICTLRITISTTTLYIYVYYTISLSHRDISSSLLHMRKVSLKIEYTQGIMLREMIIIYIKQ